METLEKYLEKMLEKIIADAEKNGSDKVMMPIVTTEEARFLLDRIRNCSVDDATSCKPYNELEKTVPLMLSDDYKAKFVAEYSQTKIRYERLKRFNNRIEAAQMKRANASPTNWAGMLGQIMNVQSVTANDVNEPKHDCPAELLREQQKKMGEYLHILEVRAVIEGIEI